MSIAAVSWALDYVDDVTSSVKLTLIALADFADEDGTCFPSQRTLAKRSVCSVRTVQRNLQELQKRGYVSVEPRYYATKDGMMHRTSNVYRLHMDMETLVSTRKPPMSDTGVADGPTTPPARPSIASSYPQTTGQPMGDNLAPMTGSYPQTPAQPMYDSEHHVIHNGGTQTGVDNTDSWDSYPQTAGHSMDATMSPIDPIGDIYAGEYPTPLSGQEPSYEPRTPGGTGGWSETNPSTTDQLGGLRALTDSDLSLLRQAIPAEMLAVSPKEYRVFVRLVRERLNAGWTVEDIRSVLASRGLPPRVGNLAALVVARFKSDIPLQQTPIRQAPAMSPASPPQSTMERELQQARWEYTCDRKAGDRLAAMGWQVWLEAHYPQLVAKIFM